ncbi:35874_t:CDS:2 [Gigaspora margarita]|uniref:35874_t:CDS:1 n=1 Tax=Gigaspora margarita TaxID=4874 RepID=A0ABN7VAP0_GIGMA|nr:35874_t:CDS:2 [Gigaspora margarita]
MDTNIPINWPTIKNNSVNEFEEVGYITKAFPILFPKGRADLRIAQYKQFRYFALNSIMRLRALENSKIYVRQNLEDAYLTVEDIQDLLYTNNLSVDQIV